ncbi:acyl-CoA/acyl-ACP dehydrogenase [Bradyrhizobium sp. KB893862 SZCCT0404]|uniref:acyl-CoA dehydrogenase family protein n=1 Tax=Bradyrhizobium sp. KB893862 SZCCT0404 TaxID=2807672 RepID=UPI001BABA3A8|nr:acyl-CoA dehydrogenase family protein [Bradyrhizobium sp. KB893862 SZCCT0404]MBR1174557.1 acyl-CoA/acyl-ACP dehydrogenase [Bradyrhizobium sp. KB893862 SZCCT0404]
MMSMAEGLQPDEFAATATRAVTACAGLSIREQAKNLAGDGLLGVIADEDVGGLALPLGFAVPVIAAAHSGLLGFPLLETILIGRLLQSSLTRLAAAIVSGEKLATIAWQGEAAAERDGGLLVLNGALARVPCAASADHLLVRMSGGAAALIPANAKGVVIEDAAGLDLTVPEHAVRLEAVEVPIGSILPPGTWDLLSSDANVLRAAAILGSAEACLALAQEHASTRRQFGHALSYNQAIRHALARQKLGLESIRHAITRSLSGDGGPVQRDAAFLAAATYGSSISEGALQIHGGMGFTWDVPVHRHLRRIRTLQAQGDASGLIGRFGRNYVSEVAPFAEAGA